MLLPRLDRTVSLVRATTAMKRIKYRSIAGFLFLYGYRCKALRAGKNFAVFRRCKLAKTDCVFSLISHGWGDNFHTGLPGFLTILIAATVWSAFNKVSSRLEPIKPATPVMSQVLGVDLSSK